MALEHIYHVVLHCLLELLFLVAVRLRHIVSSLSCPVAEEEVLPEREARAGVPAAIVEDRRCVHGVVNAPAALRGDFERVSNFL